MQPIFKVSEFVEMINMHLSHLGEVVIEGEITKIDLSQGKWLFITLKDSTSKIEVFGVAFQLSGWRALEEGMLVHVYGSPQLYMKSGRFSVTARKIVPAGEGSLKIAFERLKKQLDQEGIFDDSRKRELPQFPQNIGLITAKGSEAYKDFTKILQGRMGGLHIYFAPVSVQGEQAVQSISDAVAHFNREMPQLDVLVVCRGGGSLEDLHAFNDEQVVRALFASKIPIVCGVGHEGDVTLSDLVADIRASTPSNAAELLVEERASVISAVESMERRIISLVDSHVREAHHAIRHSTTVIEHTLKDHIAAVHACVQSFKTSVRLFDSHVQAHIQHVTQLERLLKSLDFHTILKRGFTITRDARGKIISTISQARSETDISTQTTDGTIYSRVTQLATETRHA